MSERTAGINVTVPVELFDRLLSEARAREQALSAYASSRFVAILHGDADATVTSSRELDLARQLREMTAKLAKTKNDEAAERQRVAALTKRVNELADKAMGAKPAERVRIEELEEEIRQVKQKLVPPLRFALRLTPAHEIILRTLYARSPLAMSRADLLDLTRVPGRPDAVGDRIIDIHLVKLRGVLAPLGIAISNRHGIGWSLSADAKAALEAHIVRQSDAAEGGSPNVQAEIDQLRTALAAEQAEVAAQIRLVDDMARERDVWRLRCGDKIATIGERDARIAELEAEINERQRKLFSLAARVPQPGEKIVAAPAELSAITVRTIRQFASLGHRADWIARQTGAEVEAVRAVLKAPPKRVGAGK